MSSWVSSPDSSLASGWLSSQYIGLGATGAVINAASSVGESGAGPLYGLGLAGASEYYWRVTAPPASGSLVLYEDGSFSHTGAADGAWPWEASVYADGVLAYALTVTDGVGVLAGGSLGGAVAVGDVTPGGGFYGNSLGLPTDAPVVRTLQIAPELRILLIPALEAVRMITNIRQPLPMAPGAALDIAWDWADWLPQGDTITAFAIEMPAGVSNIASGLAGSKVTVWVGIDPLLEVNTSRQVFCQITTAQGRTDRRAFALLVAPR